VRNVFTKTPGFTCKYLQHGPELSQVSPLEGFVHSTVIINPASAVAQIREGGERLFDLGEGDGQGAEHRVRVRPLRGPGGRGHEGRSDDQTFPV